MAKDTFIGTLEVPDSTTRDRLRQEALRPDLDLPEADRSSRAVIVRGRTLLVGDVVTLIDGNEVAVLAPGRGRDTFQGGWVEDRTVRCRGTFTSLQIVGVRAAATDGGTRVVSTPKGAADGQK